MTVGSSWNDATDEELVEQIQSATTIYPALRSLSCRMPGRRQSDGSYLSRDEMITILFNIMDTSVAADEGHPRHEDWVDRLAKIPELVMTAIEKEKAGPLTDAEIEAIGKGDTLMPGLTARTRPIGPQRETTTSDIEKRVADLPTEDSEPSSDFVSLDVRRLNAVTLPPIKWVIPRMIPEMATVSLAGMSNVGKTQWLAALVVGLAVGNTERMGLPQCDRKFSTIWIANEERVEDICRRLKAVVRQHGDEDSAPIVVRGKGAGMLRLVAMNEAGNLEIDETSVAKVVKEIRDTNAKLVIFDPYVTVKTIRKILSPPSAAS